MLPEGSFQIVQDQIAQVARQKAAQNLGATFLVLALALAIWSVNAGRQRALIDALNVCPRRAGKSAASCN